MRKYRLVCVMLCATLMLAITACGQRNAPVGKEEQEKPEMAEETQTFDLEAYKAQVALSSQEIYDTSRYLYAIAVTEKVWWETYSNYGGSPKSEDVAEHGFEIAFKQHDLTENDLDQWHGEIRQQYKDISLMEVEGKEAEKIAGYYEEMYVGYKSLHDIVYSPSGKAGEFEKAYKTYAAKVAGAYDDMSLYLE